MRFHLGDRRRQPLHDFNPGLPGLAGDRTVNLLGRFWGEISAKLALDPEGLVAHAMMSRDTWSTMPVRWPMANGERIAVELSGIPAFDRQRMFLGYRGFGVLRDRIIETPADRDARSVLRPPVPPKPNRRSSQILSTTFSNLETRPDAPQPAEQNRAKHSAAGKRGAVPRPRRTTASTRLRISIRWSGPPFARSVRALPHASKAPTNSRAAGSSPATAIWRRREEFPVTFASASSTTQAAPALRRDDDALVRERPILDKLPTGVLIYRLSTLLYANAAFLKAVGHASLGDFAQAGGTRLAVHRARQSLDRRRRPRTIAAHRTARRQDGSIAARLFTVEIDGENAMVLLLSPDPASRRIRAAPKPVRRRSLPFSTLPPTAS